MRIGLTVDPCIPVPPVLYGGIERIVDFLCRGLVARGHHVTLLAHADSRTSGKLVPYGVPPHTGRLPRLLELSQVAGYLLSHKFDIVHSFGRLAALAPVLALRRYPVIQSYQRDSVPWNSVGIAIRLAGSRIRFTGCSRSVYAGLPMGHRSEGRWTTVFNGVDLSKYSFSHSVAPDSPLVFLGRLEPFKGAHHAIEIAKRSGRRLVIAGNRVEVGDSSGYFDARIAPHLDDDWVRYLGPVTDSQKNALLGSAGALLMPVEWPEPFGIVMAEALACGTPVIGFPNGSVPEVVVDGLNGFVRPTVDDCVAAVVQLSAIDRRAVRKDCEARFGDATIVSQYEELYRQMCTHASCTGEPRLTERSMQHESEKAFEVAE